MKITWTEVAGKFSFDERQATIGEYLVNRGKDACLALWASGAEDGGPSPVDYAAGLAAERVDHPSTGQLVMEYLKTKKKHGEASTYLQLQYEGETTVVRQILPLLSPAQVAAFVKLDIGSLMLDVDTGYSPVDDRIAMLTSHLRHGSAITEPPADAGSEWTMSAAPLLRINGVTEHAGVEFEEVRRALALDARESTILRYLVDHLQTQCAEHWAEVTTRYGLSPLEHIVDVRRKSPGGDTNIIERSLVAYLRSVNRLGTEQTYFDVLTALEQQLYGELARLLGRDVKPQLQALGIASFLSINTGHAPLAYKLSVLYDEDLLKRGIDLFCTMPFEYVHIEDTGDVLPCCPSKFKLSIGNLRTTPMPLVWHSRAAEAVRESIHDKTFRFCIYNACEYLKEGRNKHAVK